MMYSLEVTKRFEKDLKKLDKYTQKMIINWIRKNIEKCDNPRSKGKSLSGNKKGLWRYRINDYRLICSIQDEKLIVVALAIGHRKEIYE